jgi:polynucleotide 5'-kinase involved in rRNA processing
MPLVVNTCGWIRNGGANLLAALLNIVSPSIVVDMSDALLAVKELELSSAGMLFYI